MNKHILKVMRYLDNPELFSVEEMMENAADAAEAAEAAADATYDAAAYAAEVAADARYWVNEYFKISGESKQDYIKEVERLK